MDEQNLLALLSQYKPYSTIPECSRSVDRSYMYRWSHICSLCVNKPFTVLKSCNMVLYKKNIYIG